MRYAYALIFTILLAGTAVPESVAQGRGRGETSDSRTEARDDDDRNVRTGRVRGSTGDVDRRDRDDDRNDTRPGRRAGSPNDRGDRDDDWDDDRGYRNDDGPPFCRNGNGHPVHGWEWCEDKGYGRRRIHWPGDRRDRWEDRTWKDIVFGDRRDRDGRRRRGYYDYDRRLDRATLADILGDHAYRRFDDHRRAQRLDDGLVGYWVRPDDNHSRVLHLFAGDIPLAILSDFDGDWRVDAVRVNRLR